jgi:hypothetical protein
MTGDRRHRGCFAQLRREVRRGGRREGRKEEGDPIGLAPAEFFLTGVGGQDGRRCCAFETGESKRELGFRGAAGRAVLIFRGRRSSIGCRSTTQDDWTG